VTLTTLIEGHLLSQG